MAQTWLRAGARKHATRYFDTPSIAAESRSVKSGNRAASAPIRGCYENAHSFDVVVKLLLRERTHNGGNIA